MLPTIYITDCYDENTKARQATRIQNLIPDVTSVNFIGVRSSLEAAGNLVDTLDALEGRPGLIFINVAPRGTGRWPNGTPFGYLHYNNAHIFTTIEGTGLSLLKKLAPEPLPPVRLFDVPKVVTKLEVDAETQQHIIHSQFRSFDFLPRLAAKVLTGETLESTPWSDIPPCPPAIWWKDNFGNLKTTLLPEDVDFAPDKTITLTWNNRTKHSFVCYNRLKDMPHNQTGIYIGSSGLPGKRLLEIATQKGDDLIGDYDSSLPLQVGDSITI